MKQMVRLGDDGIEVLARETMERLPNATDDEIAKVMLKKLTPPPVKPDIKVTSGTTDIPHIKVKGGEIDLVPPVERKFYETGQALTKAGAEEAKEDAAKKAAQELIDDTAKVAHPKAFWKRKGFTKKAAEETTETALKPSTPVVSDDEFTKMMRDQIGSLNLHQKFAPRLWPPRLFKSVDPKVDEWVQNNLDRIILEEIQLLNEALPATVPTESPQQNIPAMIDQVIKGGVEAYNDAIGTGNIQGAAEVVNAALQQVVQLMMQEEVPPEPEEAVKVASNVFWDVQQKTPEAQ